MTPDELAAACNMVMGLATKMMPQTPIVLLVGGASGVGSVYSNLNDEGVALVLRSASAQVTREAGPQPPAPTPGEAAR